MVTIVIRDISQFDVRLLLAFDALMAELSVTRAAVRVGLTQQGMSGQLARMREAFGDPLFVRDAAGISPTPRAEMLHLQVQQALTSLQALALSPAFDAGALDGVITVAATDYGIQLLLPPLLKIVGAEAPQLRLAVRPVNASTLSADMRERIVDLALAVPQFIPPGLQSLELFTETYVGAVRQDHPLAACPVTLDGFCAFAHVLVSPNRGDFHGPTDDALAKLGRRRDIALVVPSFSVVGALLEASDLIAVLPRRLARLSRRQLHVFDPPMPVKGFSFNAFWPDRLDADAMHKWFRGKLFEAAQGLEHKTV
jgi:DNA-binding transcriptional LysR family regulator